MKKKSLLFKSLGKLLILSAFILQGMGVSAQTTLVAGDIAFTGFNSYNTGGVNPNDFSFVILRTGGISAGTVIKFTDNGWNSKTPAALGTNEGTISWTATAALPQFTEVKIDIVDGGGTPAVNQVSHGQAIVTGGFVLSYGGDQILAYQIPATTPVFIAGVTWNVLNTAPNQTTFASWDNLTTLSFTSGRSAIPPGLTNGVNALLMTEGAEGAFNHMENGKYNCTGATGTTLSEIRAAINNRDNWLKGDAALSVAAFSLPSGCTFALGTPASITGQPQSQTACAGSPANFSVTASNATSYQWQINTGMGFTDLSNVAPYSGVTTNILTIAGTGTTPNLNGAQFRVIVKGTANSITSDAVTLTVNSGPAVSKGPSPVSVCEGQPTEFVVSATGTELSYKWQIDAGTGFTDIPEVAPFSGTTSKNLVVSAAYASANGSKIRVVVSGKCTPAVTTDGVLVTVNSKPAIKTSPKDVTACAGTKAKIYVGATGTGLQYQWQVDEGVGFSDITSGSVYSGATSDTLTINSVTTGLTGNIYRVKVIGSCTPGAISSNATLNVNQPVSITESPFIATTCEGGMATFSVKAKGTNLVYQWQESDGANWKALTNSAPYSGVTTDLLTISNVPSSLNGKSYKVYISGVCPATAATQGAALTVKSKANITKEPLPVTVCPGTNSEFVVQAQGTGISYQWQVDETNGFFDLVNELPYSGANSPNLLIKATPSSLNNFKYRVIVKGDCSSDTSAAVKLSASDLVAPVITNVPSNFTRYVTDKCQTIVQWNEAKATDNCELKSFAADHTSGTLFPLGKTVVIYQATDASGNKKIAEFTVTVLDTVKPVFTFCPEDVMIEPGKYTYKLPEATDNCTEGVQAALISGPASGSEFTIGEHVVVYEVADASGNKRRCSFKITASPVSGFAAENSALTSWTIYPNPASESVNISDLKISSGTAIIQFINAEGKVVKIVEAGVNTSEINISASDLTAGLYLVSVNNNGVVSNKKIVIK